MNNYNLIIDHAHYPMVFVKGGLLTTRIKGKEITVQVDSFFLGQYLVTQDFFVALLGKNKNPAFYQGERLPVEWLSHEEIQSFLDSLNELFSIGNEEACPYELPDEFQWEYAASYGKKSKYAGSNKYDEVAWFDDDGEGKGSYTSTMPVGLKAPNVLGLYDMSGNVYECCQYPQPEHYPLEEFWGEKEGYPFRGGSFMNYPDPAYCSVNKRHVIDKIIPSQGYGFRLARRIKPNDKEIEK